MKISQIIRKRRAVSPIIAVLLLIGLAVAAGAVLFIVVLPMITGPGGTISIDSDSTEFTDTNNNGIYDKVSYGVKNDATVDASITALTVKTSTDGNTWHNASSSVSVPISISKGSAKTGSFTFYPAATDFTTSGSVDYRLVVSFTIDTTTGEALSTISSKSHNGFSTLDVSISAEFYSSLSITGVVNPVDRGARDSAADSDDANVIAVTIANNWDCPIVLDKDLGSYGSAAPGSTTYTGGLYVSTDSNYGYSTSASVSSIYSLAVVGTDFSKSWCATTTNYDTYSGGLNYWELILDQTGDCASTDSIEGRTIEPGATVTVNWFSLGGNWGANDGWDAYCAISIFSTQIRWTDTISLTTA